MLQVYIKNPGGQRFRVSPGHIKSGTLTRPAQEDRLDPRTCEISFIRDSEHNVPCAQLAEVIVARDTDVLFRGCVEESPRISRNRKQIKAVGYEHCLMRAPAMYFYPLGSTTLAQLFADSFSHQTIPGLLAMANGCLPPGIPYTITDSSKNIAKLAGWGRKSIAGTRNLFAIDYRYAVQLTEVSALSTLQTMDNAFYRDEDDLYVRISNSNKHWGWYDLGGLAIDDAFSTSVYIGNISDYGKTISGDIELTQEDLIGDYTINILAGQGFYGHFRDDWEGHTFLDIDQNAGRESGITLDEANESDIPDIEPGSLERIAANDPKVACLTAKGLGNQYYSVANPNWKGTWTIDKIDVPYGFKDASGILIPHAIAKYTERQTDYRYKVTTRRNLVLMPGDYLTLRPLHEPEETSIACKTISEDIKTGAITLELGKKRPRNADIWAAIKGVSRGYSDRYLGQSHKSDTQQVTFYPSDPAHTGTAGVVSITVPSDVLNSVLKPRVTVQVSLSLATNNNLDIGRGAVFINTNHGDVPFGCIVATTIGNQGATIPEIDITPVVVTGGYLLGVYFYMANEAVGSHSDYTGHPQILASFTINYYKRGELTA